MPFASKAQQRWMYANRPEMARKWTDEMRGGRKASRYQKEHPIKHAKLPERIGKNARYGMNSARGSRLVESETQEVSKRVRGYDPEAARQRRLGAYTALTGVGGLALGAKGLRGVKRSGDVARRLGALKRLPNVGREEKRLLEALGGRTAYAASRKDLAYLAGGAAGLGAAGSIHRFASGRRNAGWE